MNISSTIASDYVRWRKFLHDNVHFLMKESEIHTEEHCARVLLFALLIAEEMKLPQDDREALGAASVFHDSRRMEDGYDTGHGDRAAAYYREYCQKGGLAYDQRVFDVMSYHDRDDPVGIKAMKQKKPPLKDEILLYKIFKDADALDRFRLGPNGLDPRFLRTKEAKRLVSYARKVWEEIKK